MARTETTIRRSLVAVEPSAQGQAALDAAARMAARLQAELVGLYVEDVELLRLAQFPFAREFSVHDGPEFAMGDVSRPLKYRPEMLFYREAEHENYKRLAHRYGLPFPMSVEVKHLDKVMLATEARDLMGDPPWIGMPTPLRQHIEPWLPGRAFREYRSVLTELGLWQG